MKKLLIVLILFAFSCTNNEMYKVSMDSVIILPESLELSEYSGEIIDFQINNPTAKNLYLIPDIAIYTKVEDKEYLVQRKNEISIKPTASFTFSFGGSASSTNTNSLGLSIESSKEYLIYNSKDFTINPISKRNVNFSINTSNLYYTINKKNVLINKEELYGTITFYNEGNIFRTIPFKLKLKHNTNEPMINIINF